MDRPQFSEQYKTLENRPTIINLKNSLSLPISLSLPPHLFISYYIDACQPLFPSTTQTIQNTIYMESAQCDHSDNTIIRFNVIIWTNSQINQTKVIDSYS